MGDVRDTIRGAWRAAFGLLLLAALLTGCAPKVRPSPQGAIRMGDFAGARDMVEAQVIDDRSDRRYMLDRMRAGVLNLDAGDPARAERWFAEVYDVLRTQGLNADKTVASVVLTEGVKVWKGEPFEQALALIYYGFVQAEMGSWDNARAAAGNALFYLRDFSDDPDKPRPDPGGRRIDTEEIARRAAQYEAEQRGEAPDPAYASGDAYLDHGYVAEESNFTLGYLLHGIASQQLDRDDEASDYFNRVVKLDRDLGPLVQQLRAGDYNTVLVVADGLGPRKIAVGPGGALSRYQPIDTLRGPAELRVNGEWFTDLPGVTDVNAMALDHRWNNLEDVRIAKNVIGDVLLTGGTIALLKAADDGDGTLAIVGAGVLAAGLFAKATTRANTDHCDVYPQRVFVAALNVTEPDTRVTVRMPGSPTMDATLVHLDPPVGPDAAFHYLRAPVVRDLDPASTPNENP